MVIYRIKGLDYATDICSATALQGCCASNVESASKLVLSYMDHILIYLFQCLVEIQI